MKSACFTIVKNERYFLPLVEKYYSPQVDDFYVLNHESTDGSIEALSPSTKVVTIHNEKVFEHQWLLDQVMNFQKELLKEYDVVIFCEADEFLIHREKTLRQVCQELYESEYDCLKPYGHQLLDAGVKLDRNEPILSQKKNFVRESGFDKILITKKPVVYDFGFHTALNESEMNVYREDEMYMVHLHYFDKKVFFERVEERNKLSENFANDQLGLHNQHTDMKEHKKLIDSFDDYIESSFDLNLPPLF